MKLGTRLLRDAVIGLSELEAALRAQVLYGGRLGTNLVELGFINIDELSHYLALTLGAPEATHALFEAADASLLATMSAEIAKDFVAFPLYRETDGAIAIAVIDPLNTARLVELENAIGAPIRPFAAAEIRIYYYLEKHYQIERGIRFVRTHSAPRLQGAIERRRVQGAPREMVRVEPRRTRVHAVAKQAPPPLEAIDDLLRLIAEATNRGQVADTLIRFGEGRLDILVALLIRDQKAMGWLFHSVFEAAKTTAIDQLSLSLAELSTLKLAYDAAEPYWGPLPIRDEPLEADLWSATGLTAALTNPPERVLVVPVLVRDRVVQLLFACNQDEIEGKTSRELITLANAAGAAYTQLIRASKADSAVSS